MNGDRAPGIVFDAVLAPGVAAKETLADLLKTAGGAPGVKSGVEDCRGNPRRHEGVKALKVGDKVGTECMNLPVTKSRGALNRGDPTFDSGSKVKWGSIRFMVEECKMG